MEVAGVTAYLSACLLKMADFAFDFDAVGLFYFSIIMHTICFDCKGKMLDSFNGITYFVIKDMFREVVTFLFQLVKWRFPGNQMMPVTQ